MPASIATLTDLPRRRFLALGASAAVAVALPAAPIVCEAVEAPIVPVWIVGTPGEMDWQPVRAATWEAAQLLQAIDVSGLDACEEGAASSADCSGCEFCSVFGSLEVERVSAWDGRDLNSIGGADWLRLGWGGICSRCGDEAHASDEGHAIGDEAVCGFCMTLADWEKVDPERAALLKAKIAEASDADA